MLARAEEALSSGAVMNPTHDPGLKSWVPSANEPGADFPIQNLPLGVFQPAVFRRAGNTSSPAWRPWKAMGGPAIGVAIGDRILNLQACGMAGLLEPLPH